jgi:hypothetical protein
MHMFRNKARFYGEELLAPRPNPKLKDHPLSEVRDCSFNIFAATLHIGGSSFVRNLRTRHKDVTGTHLCALVYTYTEREEGKGIEFNTTLFAICKLP